MIHENDKKQQPEEQDFMEMIIGNDKKNLQQKQQTNTSGRLYRRRKIRRNGRYKTDCK